MSPFVTGDIVKIMGIGIDEELLLVRNGRVTSLSGGTVHGVSISEGIVSIEVLRSHDDAYVLYHSIMLDDPPVIKIGNAVGQFILWSIECLRHTLEAWLMSLSKNSSLLIGGLYQKMISFNVKNSFNQLLILYQYSFIRNG